MENFNQQEQRCELLFRSLPPLWHLYTPGVDTPLVFSDVDDFELAMNALFLARLEISDIQILSFAVMSNHIHAAVVGDEGRVVDFFNRFRKRICRMLKSKNGFQIPNEFRMCLKPVPDLKFARNLIAYHNRNGYVADSRFTPFSYPWSTGPFYFNAPILEKSIQDVTFSDKRKMFRGRIPDLKSDVKVVDNHISPLSFCDVKTGMALFRNAHHYMSTVTKNIEAYSEIAAELGDISFLADDELFRQASVACRVRFGNEASLRTLSKDRKIELARHLHYDYHASNPQLRRILMLSQSEVDALFPLSSKPHL